MGAAVSVPAESKSRRHRNAAYASSKSRTTVDCVEAKRPSARVAPRPSKEAAALTHTVLKMEESPNASNDLSCTASVQDAVDVESTHARSPQVSSESTEIRPCCDGGTATVVAAARIVSHPARLGLVSGDSRSAASTSTAKESTAPAFRQKHLRHAPHVAASVSSPMDGVDVVQIEHSFPHTKGLPRELDDFELAYSRSVQDGNIVIPAAAAESFAVVQYIRPLPRQASRIVSGVSCSFSAPELVLAHLPLYTPSDVDETLAFVTLRRAGFSLCRVCQSDLSYQAKFCPECGTCVEEEEELAGSRSPVAADNASCAGPPYETSLEAPHSTSSRGSTNSSQDSARNAGSVCDATPHSALFVATAVEESNVFTLQRRHAFVRHVKVLRSREMLGMGTSGKVYRAIDTSTGQQLAVKESLINQNSPDELAAVRNELRQLSELRHPYIVEYFGCRVEAVEDNYVAYFQNSFISSHLSATESRRSSRRNSAATPNASTLPPIAPRTASENDESPKARLQEERRRNVETASLHSSNMRRRKSATSSTIRVLTLMERVECGTLAQLLADFPRGLPEQAVRRFAAQLVDAICYVHECGLCHRDIKLDNILLASDGTIRLTDFGCAVRGAGGLTGNGGASIAGTPAYMPPESLACLAQASVDWMLQGMAQDVWAIGCVVHHLLTAECPWSKTKPLNPYALLLHIQANEFPINTTVLSRHAVDFCRCCFEKDLQRRITAAELATHSFLRQISCQSRAMTFL